jgi:hypothetical protein
MSDPNAQRGDERARRSRPTPPTCDAHCPFAPLEHLTIVVVGAHQECVDGDPNSVTFRFCSHESALTTTIQPIGAERPSWLLQAEHCRHATMGVSWVTAWSVSVDSMERLGCQTSAKSSTLAPS